MATDNRILEDGNNLVTMSGDNRVLQHAFAAQSLSYFYSLEQTANAIRRAELNNEIEYIVFFDADRSRAVSIIFNSELDHTYDADRVVFNSFANVFANRNIESGDNRVIEDGSNRAINLGNYLATSNILFMPTEIQWTGGIFYNESGIWKRVESFVNVDGEWKEANAYKKISGQWKRIN